MIPLKSIETQYGFAWGAAEIERVVSLPDGSVVISISSKNRRIDVRVTKSGCMSVKFKDQEFNVPRGVGNIK